MGGSAGDYEGLALNQQDSISASFRTLAMQTDQTAPRPLGNMLKQKNIVIPIDTFSFSTFQIPSNCSVFWDIPISDPQKMCLHLWLHRSRPVVVLSCSLASEFFEPQVLGEKAAGHLEMWRWSNFQIFPMHHKSWVIHLFNKSLLNLDWIVDAFYQWLFGLFGGIQTFHDISWWPNGPTVWSLGEKKLTSNLARGHHSLGERCRKPVFRVRM